MSWSIAVTEKTKEAAIAAVREKAATLGSHMPPWATEALVGQIAAVTVPENGEVMATSCGHQDNGCGNLSQDVRLAKLAG